MTLHPASTPPSFAPEVHGGSNIASSARTAANQWTQYATKFNVDTWNQYVDRRRICEFFMSADMSNGYRAQRILHGDASIEYGVPGGYFTSNESMKHQESFITPDRPVLYQEALDAFDLKLASYDHVAPHSIAAAKRFARFEEEKAIKALTKASLSNAPTGITYYGWDESTDYALATNRTETLTGLASKAALLADASMSVVRKAFDNIATKIEDMGDDPSEYRAFLGNDLHRALVRSEEGLLLSDRDLNLRGGDYAGGKTPWDINGIGLIPSPSVYKAYGVNVTYGFSTGGTTGDHELNFATKYSSDNSNVAFVIARNDAVSGLTVGGGVNMSIFDLPEHGEGGVVLFKGVFSQAYQPARVERAFALAYDV